MNKLSKAIETINMFESIWAKKLFITLVALAIYDVLQDSSQIQPKYRRN